jgi:hypothetical protein
MAFIEKASAYFLARLAKNESTQQVVHPAVDHYGSFAALYDAGVPVASLPFGAVYDLGAGQPGGLVYGPGAVRMDGTTATADSTGNYVGFDARGSSIYAVPNVWSETANSLTAAPGGMGKYFNVAVAPGSNILDADENVWRCTIIGQAAGASIRNWERTEAIGQGAMRFAPLANRITAVGTITYQWLGAPDQQWLRDTSHDFWLGDAKPGDVGWDFMGLETRNAGIGAWLDAFADYATTREDCSRSVAVGRDAALHAVKDSDSVYVGYQAGTNVFAGNRNTAVGSRALRDGVRSEFNTAIGRSAGVVFQHGIENVFLGDVAGPELVRGNRNVLIGKSSGAFLGADANDKFVVQSGSTAPLLVGDFATQWVGVGVTSAAYTGLSAGFGRPTIAISSEEDSNGGQLLFNLRDTTVINGQGYGRIAWRGIDNQGLGIRATVSAISRGTTGETAVVVATQPASAPGDTPIDRFEVGHAGGVRVFPQAALPTGVVGRLAVLDAGSLHFHDGAAWRQVASVTTIYPGPFADDAAAATGGVPVGALYRVTGGAVAWRQV